MKKTQKKVLGAGLGIAALAAAAAGAYYLTGKEGAKHRKKLSAWATKAKKDIVSEIGKLQKVSKQTYHKAVQDVASKYQGLKNVDPKELQALITDAKGHWENIAQEIKTAAGSAANIVAKAKKARSKTGPANFKKSVRKSTKKPTKK